jgi:hypothetical protein
LVADTIPQATISAVVASHIGDTSPNYYSLSQKTFHYTHYQCESIYSRKTMRAMLPIATQQTSPPDYTPATYVVRLSKPQARLKIRILAERAGDWPEFPDPESIGASQQNNGYGDIVQYATKNNNQSVPDIRMLLISSKLLGGTATITANGVTRYRARMEMVFALERIPAPIEILKFFHNKWAIDTGSPSGIGTFSSNTLTNSPWV